jgi:hypothetical protein
MNFALRAQYRATKLGSQHGLIQIIQYGGHTTMLAQLKLLN